MNKETLIECFKNRTADRKRLLSELYFDLINSKLTIKNIVKSINTDLGLENLVKIEDIKYCRKKFKRKNIGSTMNYSTANNQNISQKIKEMKWTNPDSIEKLTLKSKFEKTDKR